tara:strand:+ start:1052 stop:3013 length:1962 start_codon:yes stop_codon:yes gene_type:complete
MPRIPTTEFISNPRRYGYDVRVDKLLLRAAISPNNPMTIQSSDVQAGQNVNVKQNPEDFTSNLGRIYSRNNFSAGQGLDTAHRADGQPDDAKRFWDSKGIDVFHGDDEVSYNVHLLYTTLTQNKSFSGTNNYIAQTTNGDIYVTDTTNIHKYNGTSWSTIAAGTSGATHNFTGIAAFGNGLYLTTANGTSGSQLIKFDGSSWSTLTTAQSSSGGLTGVWYVKNRLWISGNDGTAEYLWERSPFDAWNNAWLADADSIVEIEPTHSITGVVDGGAAVLAASTDGTVYSFKLSSAVFVNQGQTKIPYEEVHSIAAAEGIIFIGTKEVSRNVGRLYKLELVAADNLYVLANRQLIKEWVTAVDTTPKAMFVSRDSVYIGIKEANNETNLWRYYLPTGGLARDLQTAGNGFVTGILQSNGKFVICVAGSDVYIETSTYETTGYLITSAADFYTAESKQFVGAEISTKELPEETSVELFFTNNFEDLDNPSSSNYEKAINQISGTGDTEQQIKPVARYIIGKLVLNSDGTNTPEVKSLQFRALARPELVVAQIPINISDRVERPGRTPIKVRELGDALYNELRLLEGDAVTLEIFNPNEVIRGVVESISYPIIEDAERGSVTQTAILTVRGTRQQTVTQPTSVHLFGGEVLGKIRFGA